MRQTLSFYQDNTPVILTEEERAEARKTLIQMHDLVQFGLMLIGTKEQPTDIDRNAVHSLMGLNSSYHASLAKILKYEDILVQEQEMKHKEIREANLRIRELEEELGKKVSGEAISCALKEAGKKFRNWYKKAGFQYVADIRVNEYGILSGRITSELNENAPAEFVCKDATICKDATKEMEDTDNNRALLTHIFCQAFPGSSVVKFESRRNFRDKEDTSFILEADVKIPVEEILKLEVNFDA